MKKRGYGRFDGSAVIEEFTEVKWVTVELSNQPRKAALRASAAGGCE